MGTEHDRLDVLAEHAILDTAPSREFDRITALAAAAFSVPTALVTLVDEKRQWFKSRVGFPAAETPRAVAFCAVTIEHEDVLVIEDAMRDARFAANELVRGTPFIRFYAGAPVRAQTGETLGTVAIVDTKPRTLSKGEIALLRALAKLAEGELAVWRAGVAGAPAMAEAVERMRAASVARERRFATLIRNSRDVILLLDGNGQAIDVSPSVEKVLGRPRAAFLATPTMELLHPEDRAAAAAALARVVATPATAIETTFRARHADGSWRDFEVVAENLLDTTTIEAVVAHARDVTERVRAEREMRDRARQQTALAQLGAAVARTPDPREAAKLAADVVTRVVDGAVCLVLDADEAGAALRTVASAPDAHDVAMVLDDEIMTAPFALVDPQRDPRLGPLRALGAKATALLPLRVDSARRGALVVFHRDEGPFADGDIQMARGVAHLLAAKLAEHAAREQLSARERQLQAAQKIEALGRLAGGVAHDVNNVLAAITTLAQRTAEQLPSGAQPHDNVMEIRAAALRGGEITRQILAFAKRQAVAPTELRVQDVVSRVCAFLGRALDARVHLEVAADPDAPVVRADPAQVEQVVLNLCANARDAMPDGGTIHVTVRANAPWIELTVSDEGPGIAPDVVARIFEPFFTTKPPELGTGLGLSTVHGIVKQHGGRIHVETAPGKGARFVVELPIARRATNDGVLWGDALSGAGEIVLLADDNRAVRWSAAHVMISAGYRVIEATDGLDAVTKFRAHKDEIRVVVLDAVMPRASGAEALVQIRSERADVPYLFCTGYPVDDPHSLMKPYPPEELLRRIRDLLDSPSRD